MVCCENLRKSITEKEKNAWKKRIVQQSVPELKSLRVEEKNWIIDRFRWTSEGSRVQQPDNNSSSLSRSSQSREAVRLDINNNNNR